MNAGHAGGPGGQGTGYTPATCTATHNIGAALGGTGATGTQPYVPRRDRLHPAPRALPVLRHPRPTRATSSPPPSNTVGTDTQSFTGGCYGCGTPEFNTPNHQYDTSTFNQLVSAITSVEPPGVQPAGREPPEGSGVSGRAPRPIPDPIDGQKFVTGEINSLMQSPDWSSTAVVVAYDDSDGWYDHVYAGNSSDTYLTSAGGPQNQSSAGSGTTSSGGTATGSTTEGDAEVSCSVCGGTAITGSAITASTT